MRNRATGSEPAPGEIKCKKVLNEMTMDEVLSRENLNAAYLAVKANDGCPAPQLFVGTGHVQRRIISWELARELRRDLTRQWLDAVYG